MKRIIFLLIYFVLYSNEPNAQNATPDDIPKLVAQLKNAEQTQKAFLYNELSFAWGRNNVDTAIHYAKMALQTAESTKNSRERLKALNLLGDNFLKKRQCSPAKEQYEQALQLAQENTDIEMQGKALHNLGKQAQTCSSNKEDALSFYEKAFVIREKIGDKQGLSATTQNLGVLYVTENLEKSNYYFAKAKQYKEELGDRIGLATVLANLASNKMAISEWAEARSLLEQAIAINEELGNNRGLAIAYGKLAQVYQNINETPLAITFHQKGLSLLERNGDPFERAIALSNLGTSFNALSDYPKALNAFLQAESIASSIQVPQLQASIWLGLANTKGYMKDDQEAIAYYQKALGGELQLVQRSEALIALALSLLNTKQYSQALKRTEEAIVLTQKYQFLGKKGNALYVKAATLYELKRLPEALTHIRESIAIAYELKQEDYLADALKIRSVIYSEMGGEKNILALEDAQKSVQAAQKGGNLLAQAGALDRLSQAYQALNKTDEAIGALRLAEALRDSIYSISKVKSMTKQELNQEFDKERALQKLAQEKKETISELEMSRQRTTKWLLIMGLLCLLTLGGFAFNRLKEQQRKKNELLRRKIARDLHDEMGSTLSSISILSNAVQMKNDPESSLEPMAVISERTRQVMDTMSDIVWSVNPQNDDMTVVVQKMREFSAETLEAKEIQLIFEVDEAIQKLQLPTEYRKEFYFFFKEAINNAAKHAQAKSVSVQVRKVESFIHLQIQDDGCGFDPDEVKKGNGLKNLHERARELRGKLTINTKKGGGTQLYLICPVP